MSIEAEHYGETRTALAADPVIIAMAAEIREGIALGRITVEELDGWSFIRAALARYNAQGGTIGTHIGGPAEAIRRLVAEEAT